MEKKPMRVVFGETLCALAKEREDFVVLDADVSSSTQTKLFFEQHPKRFYNFGIAEANMAGAAAGMATCGLIPIVSTFAFLMALRAGDPISSLIAYNRLNVKLAGGYGGLSDFADGASHQSVMDLAVMTAMPNMTVLVPSDIESTIGAVRAMLAHQGPVYIRLSRAEVGSYHGGDEAFIIGRGRVLKDGKDVALVVCGTLLSEVLAAADELAKRGVDAAVLEMPTIKPIDEELLIEYANRTGAIVTVEEHSIIGGLGSIVASCLSQKCPVRQRQIGICDEYGRSGSYEKLLEYYGLNKMQIVQKTLDFLQINKKGRNQA